MNIREFSHNLQKVYAEMSETFSILQKQKNLSCPSDCGLCCLNPEIEANPMEMIPMALRILDEGKLEEWYQKLKSSEGLVCLVFNGKNCDLYNERPPLCRMFGVAGRINKKQEITLSVCKFLKEKFPVETEAALNSTAADTPVMAHWSSRLTTLDPHLAQERQPINRALKLALEKVALWSQYNE